MGDLEKSGQRKTRRKNIKTFVLRSVALAGVLSVAMLAPNVLGAMGKLGLLPSSRQKEIINRTRERMIKQGILQRESGRLRLTEKGRRMLLQLQMRDFVMNKQKRWDGKWRILIFDIPEQRKGLREKIRTTLISIGFIRLQDSVWIFPYDCEDLVTLLKADFRTGKQMLYMIVEELEGDAALKRQFDIH